MGQRASATSTRRRTTGSAWGSDDSASSSGPNPVTNSCFRRRWVAFWWTIRRAFSLTTEASPSSRRWSVVATTAKPGCAAPSTRASSGWGSIASMWSIVHDPDEFFVEAMEGAFPALDAMRREGTIASYGAGMNQSEMLTKFVRDTDLDVVMCAGRFTLLEQGALDELLPAATACGVSVVAAAAFNSGLLARDRPSASVTYNYAPTPPRSSPGSTQSPTCAKATGSHCRRRRCSSRSGIQRSPRCARARAPRSRCSATPASSRSRSPIRSGPTLLPPGTSVPASLHRR